MPHHVQATARVDVVGRPAVTLLVTTGCHNCEDARSELALRGARGELDLDVVFVDSAYGQALQVAHRPAMFPLVLLDDGTVSKAYNTLGKGMHAGLHGHGFVLIDAAGVQRWQGDYPSMWLDPATLLQTARCSAPAKTRPNRGPGRQNETGRNGENETERADPHSEGSARRVLHLSCRWLSDQGA